MALHDLEKENRPPNSMVPKGKASQKASTPGRRKQREDQYFDVGKVGRKTGITLKDTGVRDEHGLEPVEGIFSSPVVPVNDGHASSDGYMQESSGQDANATPHPRKTPKLPPPRQATPKHTSIGSPKRMSSARPQTRSGAASRIESDRSPASHLSKTQQPPNRVLDFAPSKLVKSIEPNSPFKPTKNLRRSLGPARANPFASPSKPVDVVIGAIQEADNEGAEEDDAQPITSGALHELTEDKALPAVDSPVPFRDIENSFHAIQDESISDLAISELEASVRRSSIRMSSAPAPPSPWQSRSGKRDRSVYEAPSDAQDTGVTLAQSHRNEHQPSSPSNERPITIAVEAELEDNVDQTIDPTLLQADEDVRAEKEWRDARRQSKKPKPNPKTGKHATVDFSNVGGPSRSPQRRSTSRGRGEGPTGAARASAGPSSKFHLRATTPFEDAGGRVSRFGRTLIEPLKYWANEVKIYKHGEMDGIVRAEEIPEKPKKKSRKKPGRKSKKGEKLSTVEEDSETESCHPDEWEDEIGVIAGYVARWDHEKKEGDATDLIKEDLAFAASSIIQRDAPGSNFSYAKILTSNFFGSGMVELPPSGYKSTKNSRNMEMVFFVVEGKVMVEIGTQEAGPNQFAISAGGCWVVPRGNNYSIANESSHRPAKIWFAQGCET